MPENTTPSKTVPTALKTIAVSEYERADKENKPKK